MSGINFGAALAAARTIAQVDDIARLLWRAHAQGEIPDEAAQAVAEAAQARRAAFGPRATIRLAAAAPSYVRRLRPRSPDRQRSLERRRRCATSGVIPSPIAAHFTMGELAALSIIGAEVRKCQSCALFLDAIAGKAGVSRTTAQNAVRLAERLGLIRRQERRRPGARSWSNIITIISREWRAWLRLDAGGRPPGLKNLSPTNNCLVSYTCDGGNRAHERHGPHPSGDSEGLAKSEGASRSGRSAAGWLAALAGGGEG